MNIARSIRGSLACLTASLAVAASAAPALADLSIDGGAVVGNGTASGAAAVSLGVFKAPVVPLALELTAAAPFNGNGYAATLDARFSPGGTTIGAGAGVGDLGNTTSTGTIYNVILGQSLTRHVGLEGRMYLGPNRRSSFFAGVRLTL